MRRWYFSVMVTFGMISICGRAFSQTTNTFPWPTNPPVGIGTDSSSPGIPLNALHIHYDPANRPIPQTLPAILRLSEGTATTTSTFGILGLIDDTTHTYSSLTTLPSMFDLILHEHDQGDIIITNFWAAGAPTHKTGGAIRFATAGDTVPLHTLVPPISQPDYERMRIMPNGNVGINLPKDSIPMEQLQLGGGTIAAAWRPDPFPGLTFYGGNRYEGLPLLGGGTVPFDFRGISFNSYHNPWVAGSSTRFARMGTSAIYFSDEKNGLLQMDAFPYDSTRGLNDFSHGMYMELSGDQGFTMWSNEGASDPFHYLFHVWRPGFISSPVTRNTNGLFFHNTPVYIGTDTGTNLTPDFTNFAHMNPNYGDGKTWMLAVNGPALFKEAFVSLDWPDWVFGAKYQPMPLLDLEKYISINHHLPGIPSADSMAKTGVPLGQTQVKIMEKVEEQALYTISQQKQIDTLTARVQALEAQVEALLNRNGGKQ